ncbi:unnamed protein product, partial [Timema podura]|nr:unnamed protein product [Timema podura]
SQGVMLPAMHSMFGQWFPPNEQTSFSGIIFSAMHLGTVTAMGLSGYLVAWGGWELVFYVFGGSAVVFFLPWLYLVYNSPQAHPRISLQEKTYILSGLRKDLEKQKSKVLVPWGRMLTSVPVWAGIYMNFGLTWVLYTLLAQLPTYTKNILHFDIKQETEGSVIERKETRLEESRRVREWSSVPESEPAYRVSGIACPGVGWRVHCVE